MQNYKKRDRQDLKFLSGQALLLVTFAINLFSTLATILIISRLGITKEARILSLSPDIDEILVNQNVVSSTVSVYGGDLESRIIEANKIALQPINSHGGEFTQLLIDGSSIGMRAKAFGGRQAISHPGLSFTIPKRLNRLESPNGISNLHAVRSHLRKTVTQPLDEYRDEHHLSIESTEMLELSGNMGVSVHSKEIDIRSSETIAMASKSGPIVIHAGKGLFLPMIRRAAEINNQDVDLSSETSYTTPERFYLCIRSDGMLYKSPGVC